MHDLACETHVVLQEVDMVSEHNMFYVCCDSTAVSIVRMAGCLHASACNHMWLCQQLCTNVGPSFTLWERNVTGMVHDRAAPGCGTKPW